GLEGTHDWRAALRLDRVHARALGTDQPDRLQFLERFPHANEAGAAAGRIENRVRQLPAQLLRKLESHHFLALEAVRLLQSRAVEPQPLRSALPDQRAAFVDLPIGDIDARAISG